MFHCSWREHIFVDKRAAQLSRVLNTIGTVTKRNSLGSIFSLGTINLKCSLSIISPRTFLFQLYTTYVYISTLVIAQNQSHMPDVCNIYFIYGLPAIYWNTYSLFCWYQDIQILFLCNAITLNRMLFCFNLFHYASDVGFSSWAIELHINYIYIICVCRKITCRNLRNSFMMLI